MTKYSFFFALLLFSFNLAASDVVNTLECEHKEAAPRLLERLFRTSAKKFVGTYSSELKNEEETVDYIDCYKKNEKLHSKFVSKYQSQIKKASQLTGIPFSVLACLYFRESSMWAMVTSDKGAVGIAQLTDSTISQINLMVNTKPYDKARIQNIENYIEYYNRKFKSSKINPEATKQMDEIIKMTKSSEVMSDAPLLAFRKSLDSTKKSIDRKSNKTKDEVKFLEKVNYSIMEVDVNIEYYRLRKIWDSYWGNPKTRKTKVDANNIEQSIIAGALLLSNDLATLAPEGGWPKETTEIDKYTLIAGAYNIGAGKFPEICDTAKPYADCEAKMAQHSEENSNHMHTIRNCIKKGSDAPPSGDREKDCS